jgi:O-methyltransferase involved in polyketide biosynthesis
VLTGPNESNIYRHRIIDDYLRDVLKENPAARIFIIGAGYDSRAYRLTGGIWTELDQYEVIHKKNERLPISECRNRLMRVSIDFGEESLRKKLAPFRTDERVVVVVEGVFLYLDREAMKTVIEALRSVFPDHSLICELMMRKFFEKYLRPFNEIVKSVGAQLQYIVDEQEELFYRAGYRLREKKSIIGTASRNGHFSPIPRYLIPFFRTAVQGYSVYVFDFG